MEIDTPHGPARATVRRPAHPRGLLVLGHGAGGGIGAPDLSAAARAADDAAVAVALVEQPYRVAGRRSPSPAAQLDAAWLAVVRRLRRDLLARVPLVVGGRSSGARVACRTAAAAGADGVLCLAFPLQPPGRADRPGRSDELDAVAVPVLVVQGERDPFGMPRAAKGRTVVRLAGDHGLKSDVRGVESAVATWLEELLAPDPATTIARRS